MNKGFWTALALVLPLFLIGATGAHATPSPTVEPGNSGGAFERWLDLVPTRRAEVADFEAFLTQQNVAGILPTREILLNDTDWSACHMDEAYTLTQRAYWPHIVNTLRYLRDEIVPLIGPVQVVSGYRDLKLNTCAGGAVHSAHAQFYAFDLMPVRTISRSTLIAQVCANHTRYGAAYNAGLGIYEGTKFHLDTRSFRRWGPDYRGVSSPCIRYEASLKTKKSKRQLAKVTPRLRLAMLAD